MANSCSIEIDGRQFISQAQMMCDRLAPGMLMVSQTMATKIEGWAQENASWHDRTTNARQSLNCKAYLEGAHHVCIELRHGVEYGIWLELAHQKKYAILEKSIEANKDLVMRAWTSFVNTLG